MSRIYKVCDKLFISGEIAAANIDLLKKNGISHVLNCAKNCTYKTNKDIKYFRIDIDDECNFPIHEYLPKGHEFMDEVLVKGGGKGILVHCRAGLSRSASTIISYFMIRKDLVKKDSILNLSEAYEYLEKKRERRLTVNFGFMFRLCIFEKDVLGSTSVNYEDWLDKKVHTDLNKVIPGSVSEEEVKEEFSKVKVEDFKDSGKVNVAEYIKKLVSVAVRVEDYALSKLQ